MFSFVSLSFQFLSSCPSCLPPPDLLILNEIVSRGAIWAVGSRPSGPNFILTPKEDWLWGAACPLGSFIWAGPHHHSPFKSSQNTAANWAGGGGSVAETEGVFGDSVALGFRGAPQTWAWMRVAIHLWPCKLKLIIL